MYTKLFVNPVQTLHSQSSDLLFNQLYVRNHSTFIEFKKNVYISSKPEAFASMVSTIGSHSAIKTASY